MHELYTFIELIKKTGYPLEVSYFINRRCNLRCAHCYVAYENDERELSIPEWEKTFDDLLELGALTFGNVGMEPTLEWNKTVRLLEFFKGKKSVFPKLRYGIVTNAVKLDKKRSDELLRSEIDYVDVSIDGDKLRHDAIRGNGMYDRTVNNIRLMDPCLKEKLFISFTATKDNMDSLPDLIRSLYALGVKNFLISPYISTAVGPNVHFRGLIIKNDSLVDMVSSIIKGEAIPFDCYENLKIYIKSDYVTAFDLMQQYVSRGIIRLDGLMTDEYGLLFDRYTYGTNQIILNLLPFRDDFMKTIRLSHNGYVSNCYDMFFVDYKQRTLGNVRDTPIAEILNNYKI